MMIYTDYEFYVENFYGSIIPDAGSFNYCVKSASQYINTVTFGRIKSEDDITEDVKNACCAAAEIYYTKPTGGIKHEKIGDYSVTYDMAEKTSFQNCLYSNVKLWLGSSGLMYPGLSSWE